MGLQCREVERCHWGGRSLSSACSDTTESRSEITSRSHAPTSANITEPEAGLLPWRQLVCKGLRRDDSGMWATGWRGRMGGGRQVGRGWGL